MAAVTKISADHSITTVLSAADTSFWLKSALREALARDPIDAATDAALLSELLGARADAALSVATRQSASDLGTANNRGPAG